MLSMTIFLSCGRNHSAFDKKKKKKLKKEGNKDDRRGTERVLVPNSSVEEVFPLHHQTSLRYHQFA